MLALYAALPPFAIDTYMPAFGLISKYFNVPIQHIIVSITTYFVGFGLGMLIWGALSDRYGRKKVLMAGMLMYIISTVLCAISPDFETLTWMRLIQGLGDSSGSVIAMAIARDCYEGKHLTKTIASMVMIMMAAPIISPIIGSLIVNLSGRWQDIFHFLTFYGLFLLVMTLFMPETLDKQKRETHAFKTILSYFHHLKNIPFLGYSITSGLCFAAFFTYISSSSVLMMGYFNTGYILYCTLFGLNFIGVLSAQYLVKKKIDVISEHYLISTGFIASFIGMLISSLFTYFVVNLYGFMAGILLITFGFALTSSIITSKSLNALNKAFGAGNAINNLIKFSLASIASFTISYFHGYALMQQITIQQLIIILASLMIFYATYFLNNRTRRQ
jgi:DHA1 family bicyclomycin/chloramphenicol resistance-like MFS transporter